MPIDLSKRRQLHRPQYMHLRHWMDRISVPDICTRLEFILHIFRICWQCIIIIFNSFDSLCQWLPRRKLGSGPSCSARNNLAYSDVWAFLDSICIRFVDDSVIVSSFHVIIINIIQYFRDNLQGTQSYGTYGNEASASTFSTNFASLLTPSTNMLFATGDRSNVSFQNMIWLQSSHDKLCCFSGWLQHGMMSQAIQADLPIALFKALVLIRIHVSWALITIT